MENCACLIAIVSDITGFECLLKSNTTMYLFQDGKPEETLYQEINIVQLSALVVHEIQEP